MKEKNNNKTTELSSHIVKAGHRVYFVDAKVDSHGSRFLSLSECKSSAQGLGRDRQRIHIYEEDLSKVLAALSEALGSLGYDLALTPVASQATRSDQAQTYGTQGRATGITIPTLDEMLRDHQTEDEA